MRCACCNAKPHTFIKGCKSLRVHNAKRAETLFYTWHTLDAPPPVSQRHGTFPHLLFNQRRNGQFSASSGKQLGYPPTRRWGIKLGRIGEPPSSSVCVNGSAFRNDPGKGRKRNMLRTFNSRPRAPVFFTHPITHPLLAKRPHHNLLLMKKSPSHQCMSFILPLLLYYPLSFINLSWFLWSTCLQTVILSTNLTQKRKKLT